MKMTTGWWALRTTGLLVLWVVFAGLLFLALGIAGHDGLHTLLNERAKSSQSVLVSLCRSVTHGLQGVGLLNSMNGFEWQLAAVSLAAAFFVWMPSFSLLYRKFSKTLWTCSRW